MSWRVEGGNCSPCLSAEAVRLAQKSRFLVVGQFEFDAI